MIRLRLFILSFFLLSASILIAQSVRGVILDQEQHPVAEALIYNQGQNVHTHSGIDGTFIIDRSRIGDTLQVIFLGYQTKKVPIVRTDIAVEIILEEQSYSLNEVVILPQINALNQIVNMDIRMHPVNSSQDILRLVPGLVIGQHAGGGKAEQLFLRGFDLDHGTDILITADGLPVNMVSHAHGHGYADLHFIIPETVDRIDFGKGPFYADKGNFNTAGYVDFKTRQALDKSLIKLEAGQFQTRRLLGMFDIIHSDQHQAYIASEYQSTDGPFDSPQHFNRYNIMAKFTTRIQTNDRVSILASYFSSRWDASGQIPQRAVDDGSISRFGAIDDTEGGQTSRSNLLLSYDRRQGERTFFKHALYYSRYDFDLFSNFTFFLHDPINGDQIRQTENRQILGWNSSAEHSFACGLVDGLLQAGLQFRYDDIQDNTLAHTANRTELVEEIRKGDVRETTVGLYVEPQFRYGRWMVSPGLRVDGFDFTYTDQIAREQETASEDKLILSPKLNILFNALPTLQVYAKSGKGFHSNDTRVITAQTGRAILPAAWGLDLGFIWKPQPSIMINTAFWHLDLEQEFVYVGDEGVIEPGGRTRRRGVDLSVRYHPLSWLYTSLDATWAHARARDEADQENHIPLAADRVLHGGVSVQLPFGLYGGIKYRHIQDRPANEDASITAVGYTIIDGNVGMAWKNLEIGIQIQNLLNTSWNETQFATTSRLKDEPLPVEEIHFTPGTPFFAKGMISYSF